MKIFSCTMNNFYRAEIVVRKHEKTQNIAFKNLLDVWIHAMIEQWTRSPKRLSYAKLKGWTKIQIWSQTFLFKTIFLDGVPLYFKTFLVIQVKKTPPSKWAICSKKPFSQKIQKKIFVPYPNGKVEFLLQSYQFTFENNAHLLKTRTGRPGWSCLIGVSQRCLVGL